MKRAIALGTFDGVHIGHRAIINAAIDKAAELDMEPMIYTFTAHPMALFGKQPPAADDAVRTHGCAWRHGLHAQRG